MLNVVALQGRLVRDPELTKVGNDGISRTRFTLAVDRSFVQKGQERQADFIDCTAWRGTADFINKYFAKGQMIVVNGSIQTHTGENREGQKRKYVSVNVEQANFCGSKSENGGGTSEQAAPPAQAAAPDATGGTPDDDFTYIDEDEDLPF